MYPEAKGAAAGAPRSPRCSSHAPKAVSSLEKPIEYREQAELSLATSALCVPHLLPDAGSKGNSYECYQICRGPSKCTSVSGRCRAG